MGQKASGKPHPGKPMELMGELLMMAATLSTTVDTDMIMQS